MRVFSYALMALLVGIADPANAATRTFQATFSGYFDLNDAAATLGLDPLQRELVFTWTFDDSATPLSGPSHNVNVSGVYDSVEIPYQSFTATVGGQVLSGQPSLTTNDSVEILDGITDGALGIGDRLLVSSFTDGTSPNGTKILEMVLQATDSDETTFGRSPTDPLFSGLAHPSAAELNALGLSFGRVTILRPDGGGVAELQAFNAVFSEVRPVPLPAGLPLLVAGLATMALIRRKSWTSDSKVGDSIRSE